jgi:hypothetical protein
MHFVLLGSHASQSPLSLFFVCFRAVSCSSWAPHPEADEDALPVVDVAPVLVRVLNGGRTQARPCELRIQLHDAHGRSPAVVRVAR